MVKKVLLLLTPGIINAEGSSTGSRGGTASGVPALPVNLVGARSVIGPNLPHNDLISLAWSQLGAVPPHPAMFRIPSFPPAMNPALGRSRFTTRPGMPYGLPRIVYYDPALGPPIGSIPLIPPAFDDRLITPPTARTNDYMPFIEPLPLPSSYAHLHPSAHDPLRVSVPPLPSAVFPPSVAAASANLMTAPIGYPMLNPNAAQIGNSPITQPIVTPGTNAVMAPLAPIAAPIGNPITNTPIGNPFGTPMIAPVSTSLANPIAAPIVNPMPNTLMQPVANPMMNSIGGPIPISGVGPMNNLGLYPGLVPSPYYNDYQGQAPGLQRLTAADAALMGGVRTTPGDEALGRTNLIRRPMSLGSV